MHKSAGVTVSDPDANDRIGIVVVEDEAMIRTELVQAFPHYGFRVLGAEDAAEALKILQDEARDPRAKVLGAQMCHARIGAHAGIPQKTAHLFGGRDRERKKIRSVFIYINPRPTSQ